MGQRSFYGQRRKPPWLRVRFSLVLMVTLYMGSSLAEAGFRDPNANNQVFFVDTAGALCSRSSGHAVDIEGDVEPTIRADVPSSHAFMISA